MKAHAAHRGPPPDVDEGDAPDLAALLRRELRPTPGRLGDSRAHRRRGADRRGHLGDVPHPRHCRLGLYCSVPVGSRGGLHGADGADRRHRRRAGDFRDDRRLHAQPVGAGATYSANGGNDLWRDVSLAGLAAGAGVLRRRLHRRLRADLGRSGARPRVAARDRGQRAAVRVAGDFLRPAGRSTGAFPPLAEPGCCPAHRAADRRQPADRARPGTPSPPRAGRAVGDVSALLRGREGSGTPARSPGLRRHRAAAQAARSRRPAPPRPGPPGLGRLADRRHRPARPPAALLVACRGQRSQSAGLSRGRLPRS